MFAVSASTRPASLSPRPVFGSERLSPATDTPPRSVACWRVAIFLETGRLAETRFGRWLATHQHGSTVVSAQSRREQGVPPPDLRATKQGLQARAFATFPGFGRNT